MPAIYNNDIIVLYQCIKMLYMMDYNDNYKVLSYIADIIARTDGKF